MNNFANLCPHAKAYTKITFWPLQAKKRRRITSLFFGINKFNVTPEHYLNI
jgi:hypothetical protein